MFSSRRAEQRRITVLRWLHDQGESGGYELWRDTGIRLFRLYPLLARLEAQGLVSRTWKGEPSRVLYALTEKGTQEVQRSRPD